MRGKEEDERRENDQKTERVYFACEKTSTCDRERERERSVHAERKKRGSKLG